MARRNWNVWKWLIFTFCFQAACKCVWEAKTCFCLKVSKRLWCLQKPIKHNELFSVAEIKTRSSGNRIPTHDSFWQSLRRSLGQSFAHSLRQSFWRLQINFSLIWIKAREMINCEWPDEKEVWNPKFGYLSRRVNTESKTESSVAESGAWWSLCWKVPTLKLLKRLTGSLVESFDSKLSIERLIAKQKTDSRISGEWESDCWARKAISMQESDRNGALNWNS